jgi:hypothetical protein
MAGRCGGLGFENDTDASVEGTGDFAKHAEGMTFVGSRFEAADVLLGGP